MKIFILGWFLLLIFLVNSCTQAEKKINKIGTNNLDTNNPPVKIDKINILIELSKYTTIYGEANNILVHRTSLNEATTAVDPLKKLREIDNSIVRLNELKEQLNLKSPSKRFIDLHIYTERYTLTVIEILEYEKLYYETQNPAYFGRVDKATTKANEYLEKIEVEFDHIYYEYKSEEMG